MKLVATKGKSGRRLSVPVTRASSHPASGNSATQRSAIRKHPSTPSRTPLGSAEYVLAHALRGRSLSPFERRLVDVLHADIFRRPEDMRLSEHCALSYSRLRYLREELDLRIDDLFSNIDHLLALHEWVSLVDGTLTTLLSIHYNLCIGSILRQGQNRPELQSYLSELERADTIGVFLATELGYGNNLQGLETEAVYDHRASEFVINTPSIQAQKFMPNTAAEGIAKLAVVLARLRVSDKDCGVFPFIVRIRTADALCPGVTVTPLGEKPDYALDNGITSFDRVRIPRKNWLSGEASGIDAAGAFSSSVVSRARRFLLAMEQVQAGKLCLSVCALAYSRAALQLTLRYAEQRKTFGPGREDVPILHYRTYQRAIFEAVATCYAAAFLVQHVTALYQGRQGRDDVEVNRLLALCKVFVSSRALAALSLCRERVGAQGLFSANRIITYWINTNGIVTAEGDNEVLQLKAARELLIGQQYTPPAEAQGLRVPILASPDFLISLVCERERQLHRHLLNARVRATGSSSPFERWNDQLPELVDLASVHSVRLALECFNRVLDNAEVPPARAVLDRLLRLFALQEIARFSTELLATGVIDPAIASQIGSERTRLAAELRNDALRIAEAFDIPNSLLAAPIGDNYINWYGELTSSAGPRTSVIRLNGNELQSCDSKESA